MENKFRKVVLVLVVICFTLTATNAILALHLAKHHEDENHDLEHCSICRQAVINTAKAVLPNAPVVTELTVAIGDVVTVQDFIKHFKFLTPYMRAPPVAD